MKVEQFFKEWISTRPNLKSEFHDAGIEAIAFADAYHKSQSIQMKERIKELEDALQIARSTIKVWHGDVAWDLYQISPEMKMINNALNPKTEKCKCEFPLVRNDGKEYCGTCNKDI